MLLLLLMWITVTCLVHLGKTSLVDCILKQVGTIDASSLNLRIMDSNVIEKERGITIFSKYTSFNWKNNLVNIVDTPGHADFGGEVERALSLVQGAILVVDANEGPMPQTRYVLSKALKAEKQIIIVQNKVDRDNSRCDEIDSEIFDMFIQLEASESQMNYKTLYASAKYGWISDNHQDRNNDSMALLLDAIVSEIKPPRVETLNHHFSFLINSIEHNNYLGKKYMGMVNSGKIAIGDSVKVISPENNETIGGPVKISKIMKSKNLNEVYFLSSLIIYIDALV